MAQKDHLVILVHGIRTRALWVGPVAEALRSEGFAVEPTNYGRFDLIRFLLPVTWFRRWAVNTVWIDISTAIRNYPNAEYSVIAHSFGSYIVSRLLVKHFSFEPKRIIFCGSIVKYRFPFQEYDRRYEPPVLNEVGASDVWPLVAESVTWGYGSSGTYGFHRPGIKDRTHVGLAHGDFLNACFVKKFWVPFLKSGEIAPTEHLRGGVPWYLGALSVLRLKYVLLMALMVGLWQGAPDSIRCRVTGVLPTARLDVCVGPDQAGGPILKATEQKQQTAEAREKAGENEQLVRSDKSPLTAIPASHVIGADVVNAKGGQIAEIVDLVKETGENQLMAVLSVGGFLGIGDLKVVVPIRDLDVTQDRKIVMASATEEGLKSMPQYDEAKYESIYAQK